MEKVKSILKNKMQMIRHTDVENICLVGPVRLPVKQGDFEAVFNWYCWLTVDAKWTYEEVIENVSNMNLADTQQSSILLYGDFKNADDAWVRMHSICHTGDIFGSQRCDCGYQLHAAMEMVVDHGHGAIFYLANHEGRGIGLFSKSLAYLLQEDEYDTVEANHALGFEDDTRSYEEAITVLSALREKSVKLITNNPNKLAALEAKGLLAEGHISLWGGKTETNADYLQTKIEKAGHIPVESLKVTVS